MHLVTAPTALAACDRTARAHNKSGLMSVADGPVQSRCWTLQVQANWLEPWKANIWARSLDVVDFYGSPTSIRPFRSSGLCNRHDACSS